MFRPAALSSDALPSIDTLQHILAVDPAVVRGYAAGVAQALSQGPFTLDRRDRLIGRAKHLGIGRFEAAVVLAVVERQQPLLPVFVSPPARPFMQHAARLTRWSMLTTACTVQLVILAGAWWLIA